MECVLQYRHLYLKTTTTTKNKYVNVWNLRQRFESTRFTFVLLDHYWLQITIYAKEKVMSLVVKVKHISYCPLQPFDCCSVSEIIRPKSYQLEKSCITYFPGLIVSLSVIIYVILEIIKYRSQFSHVALTLWILLGAWYYLIFW